MSHSPSTSQDLLNKVESKLDTTVKIEDELLAWSCYGAKMVYHQSCRHCVRLEFDCLLKSVQEFKIEVMSEAIVFEDAELLQLVTGGEFRNLIVEVRFKLSEIKLQPQQASDCRQKYKHIGCNHDLLTWFLFDQNTAHVGIETAENFTGALKTIPFSKAEK